MKQRKKAIEPEVVHAEIVKATGQAVEKILNFQDPELIMAFIESQDVRGTSKIIYRKGAEYFINWLNGNGIERPQRTDILNFKIYLQELSLSVNSVNSYLVAVKRFFAFLEGARIYPDVAKNVKGLRQPKRHLREAPTLDQVREVLDKIDVSTIQGARDFAIVNLMARTGLRTIEIIRADLEDLKMEGGEGILYVQGKGRDEKDDFVIVTKDALKPIRAYLKARGKVGRSDPLFVSLSDRNKGQRLSTRTLRKTVKDNLRAIGLDNPKLSAHSLRHFFATQALKGGADLIQVKEAMRHSDISVTQRYLHNLERIEKGAERFIHF